MIATNTTAQKIQMLLKITVPILITQIAMYLVTFFDIYMTSRYATDDLAGVSIGASFWLPVYIGLVGILMAITPIAAQFLGAKKNQDVKETVQQGIYLSVIIGLAVFLFFWMGTDPLLALMDLEPAVAAIASEYLFALSLGAIPLFAYNAIRSYVDALGATRTSMVISLLSAPINILLNYLLIFGNWGFPELGGIGAGYASAITYWLVLFIAMWVIHTQTPFKEFRVFTGWQRLSAARFKEILKIGVPIGLSLFAETSIFSAVTLAVSVYGTLTIASHQIAMNFTSLLYMVPLSLSMGVTILVGFEVGANRLNDARRYSALSLMGATGFGLISAASLLFLREPIAALYTTDPEVIALVAQFLVFAAAFQFSDAIQTTLQGALLGHKDVNITLVMTIIAYWVIGLPSGILLAVYTDTGVFGYWIGLIAGVTAAAITLAIRLKTIQRKAPAAQPETN